MLHGLWGHKYWVDASTSNKKYVDAVHLRPTTDTTPLVEPSKEVQFTLNRFLQYNSGVREAAGPIITIPASVFRPHAMAPRHQPE